MPGWGPERSIRAAISARELHPHKIHAYRIPAHEADIPIKMHAQKMYPFEVYRHTHGTSVRETPMVNS